MRKAKLVARVIFSSSLWLSETWNPAANMRSRLRSWGARALARAQGVRRKIGDGIGDFWRRTHRLGHTLARKLDANLDQKRRQCLHRWAGHLARASDGVLFDALRARNLA